MRASFVDVGDVRRKPSRRLLRSQHKLMLHPAPTEPAPADLSVARRQSAGAQADRPVNSTRTQKRKCALGTVPRRRQGAGGVCWTEVLAACATILALPATENGWPSQYGDANDVVRNVCVWHARSYALHLRGCAVHRALVQVQSSSAAHEENPASRTTKLGTRRTWGATPTK